MLVATLVIDDESTIRPSGHSLRVDDMHITPTSSTAARTLAAALERLAASLLSEEIARKVTDPEPDGPLAAITASEARTLDTDR